MKSFLNEVGHDLTAFTSIFNFIKDLVFLMEADGESFRYIYVNKSAREVMNIDERIIGRRIEEQVSKELAGLLIPKYKQVLANLETVDFLEVIDTDRGHFIGEASLNPILSNNGSCHYILAIVRDITVKKQEEQELMKTKKRLEQNQERLTSLIAHNADAVYEMDLQGAFISINKAFTAVSGYSEDEILGTTFIPLIVRDKREETVSRFMSSLNGKQEEYETCILSKDGKLIHLLVKNVPIIVDGEIVGIYGIASDITEKNRISRLLRESEQKYKSLFENHPDAIFSYDLEGNFTSGNDRVELMTGFSKKEFLGKSFIPLMVPEHVGKTINNFNRAIKDKMTQNYEVALQHKSGRRVELSVMSIPIIVDEQVIGVYGIAKDVTEIKRVQEALIETKEELEVFWNSSIDPIYYFAKGRILKVNPAFEKIFGYTEEEVAEEMGLIIPDTQSNERKEIYEKINAGKTITSYETVRKTKNGEILDVIASYTPVRDESGNIVGATAFYKDITDLRKINKELHVSQEKYRLITENAFDVINLMNTSGIVEYVSPSNESILGYKYSEYVGLPFTAYIHPDDIPALEKGFERMKMGESKPSPYELRAKHKNGEYIWIEASTTQIMENGEVKQFVTIARDITEQKRNREELAKMAYYDYLTGLPNRRTFDEQFENAVYQADRSQKSVALMMIDGRKFKQINDTYGHDAGDAVLIEMAKRLKASVRYTDTVSRLGGDEMGVILPEVESPEIAKSIAERIIESFKEPLYFKGNEIKMGAGIGVSFYPEHSSDKKELFKFADTALYIAKKSDQDEYRIFNRNML